MDQAKFLQAVALTHQIKDVGKQKDNILSDFDQMINNSNISDPYFTNMANSLRSNIAAYFDAKIAPLNDQFNAL